MNTSPRAVVNISLAVSVSAASVPSAASAGDMFTIRHFFSEIAITDRSSLPYFLFDHEQLIKGQLPPSTLFCFLGNKGTGTGRGNYEEEQEDAKPQFVNKELLSSTRRFFFFFFGKLFLEWGGG